VAETVDNNLEEIIRGCVRKKGKSQELLYKRFFGYALKMALIYNSNRDNALEIVNDSFVKVFSQIYRFDNSVPFKSWLGKIVINTSIDRFRKNRRHVQSDNGELFMIPDTSPGVINRLTAEEIMKLLDQLPEVQRIVFSLHEIEGYSHDEISELLNIPDNTSRVYLTRARKKMRDLFQVYFSINYEKYGN
jgi:RNA polymerase sigma factor (sigma-70 family)